MDKTHPEGLAFAPKGHGFTTTIERIPTILPLLLLTRRTIDAVRRNHPGEWDAAFDATPHRVDIATKDLRPMTPRRVIRFSDDERSRLATLAVLREHGLFHEDDGSLVVGDRVDE